MAALVGFLIGWIVCWASDRLAVCFAHPASVDRARRGTEPFRVNDGLWTLGSPKFWRLHLASAILTATLFGYLWEVHGPSWDAVRLAAGHSFLLVVCLIDLKSNVVPNILVYPAMVLILVTRGLASGDDFLSAAVGGSFAFLIFYATAALRPGELGGGDIKLATLIGLSFGFPRTIWALVAGALAGGAVALGLMQILRWQPERKIPYAPFLCLGAWVALVYDPLPLLVNLRWG
jgi:prepilin signal peptidase PulO-like enzyme (type II secretory pathway)